MSALKSGLGALLALLYALAFAAAYGDYLRKAGQWFADALLLIVALPFNSVMVWLYGAYPFSGDATLKVIAAALFGIALAYVAGALIEALLRKLAKAIRR